MRNDPQIACKTHNILGSFSFQGGEAQLYTPSPPPPPPQPRIINVSPKLHEINLRGLFFILGVYPKIPLQELTYSWLGILFYIPMCISDSKQNQNFPSTLFKIQRILASIPIQTKRRIMKVILNIRTARKRENPKKNQEET